MIHDGAWKIIEHGSMYWRDDLDSQLPLADYFAPRQSARADRARENARIVNRNRKYTPAARRFVRENG